MLKSYGGIVVGGVVVRIRGSGFGGLEIFGLARSRDVFSAVPKRLCATSTHHPPQPNHGTNVLDDNFTRDPGAIGARARYETLLLGQLPTVV